LPKDSCYSITFVKLSDIELHFTSYKTYVAIWYF